MRTASVTPVPTSRSDGDAAAAGRSSGVGEPVPDTVEDYAAGAWLGTRNAITVLPSVACLAALRQQAKGGRAPDAYLGFGNPLLVGASGTDRRAWSAQSCANAIKPVE